MRLFPLLALLMFSSLLHAQPPVASFDLHHYGRFYHILPTADGGYALAGEGNGPTGWLGSPLLVKLDSLHNLEWTYYFSTLRGAFSEVVEDGDGNLVAVVQDRYYSEKTYVRSVDKNGVLNWSSTLGWPYPPGYENPSITVLADNSVLVNYHVDQGYFAAKVKSKLARFSQSGTMIFDQYLLASGGSNYIASSDIQTAFAGALAIMSCTGPTCVEDRFLLPISASGSPGTPVALPLMHPDGTIAYRHLRLFSDGSTAFSGMARSGWDGQTGVVTKKDPLFNTVWSSDIKISGFSNVDIRGLEILGDSSVLVLFRASASWSGLGSSINGIAQFDASTGALKTIGRMAYSTSTYALNNFSVLEDGQVAYVITNAAGDSAFLYEHAIPDGFFISGSVYADLNLNGVFDATETGLPGQVIDDGLGFSFTTDANGHYLLISADTATVLHTNSSITGWVPTLPVDGSATIFGASGVTDSLDFGWAPLTDSANLTISTSVSPLRPGIPARFHLWYSNVGIDSIEPVISLKHNALLDITGTSIPPVLTVPGFLSFSPGYLSFLESGHIQVDFIAPASSFAAGDILEFVARITPDDFEISNNLDSVQVEITGSYDPNDKLALPLGIFEPNFIPETTEIIDYTIRFQNTGNDTAFTVRITDVIDTTVLDPTTFAPVGSSHPYTWLWDQEKKFEFRFENILLPDSTTNLTGSQGHVRFQMHLQSGIPIGTVISNSAAIYFDFNDPVITEPVFRTFQNPPPPPDTTTSGTTQIVDQVTLFPNPANEQVQIFLPDNFPAEQAVVSIFDVMGRLVLHTSYTSRLALDLPAGHYNLVVKSGKRSAFGKLAIY